MVEFSPKSVVARIYDAFNERNADALDELLSPDFVDYTAGPRQKPGAAGIKEIWSLIWSKYPSVQIRVEEILAEGETVATRLTFVTVEENSENKIGWMVEMINVVRGKGTALWNMIQWSTTDR